MTEEDIHCYWPLVDEADRVELTAFVKFTCSRARKAERGDNTLDCVWVRKWKFIQIPDGTTQWIIKSRLCGRGFLDKQKLEVNRHSTTASRMSQRIGVSMAVQND